MRKNSLTLLAAATLGLAVSQVYRQLTCRGKLQPMSRRHHRHMFGPDVISAPTSGGAWANLEVTDVATGVTASRNSGGFAGGGQIGCDYG